MSENLPDIKKGQMSISQYLKCCLCSSSILYTDKLNNILSTYIIHEFLCEVMVNWLETILSAIKMWKRKHYIRGDS